MERRRIGSLDVSVVGLGTNNFGFYMREDEVAPVVHAALDHGVNFFDTADVYRTSEGWLGAALAGRRAEVVIATKFGNRRQGEKWGVCARPDYVRQALEASLKRLGTDHIDLYQLHGYDADTPIADTLGALSEAVNEGKIREFGCSNFTAAQLEEAAVEAGSGRGFASVQNHYNMLNRGDEVGALPACRRLGIAYIPYWPLASGVLTGKYRRGLNPAEGTRLHRMGERGSAMLSEATFDTLDALTSWAAGRGRTLLELAVAWLAARPGVVSVIAGATTPDQAVANSEAGDWVLAPEESSAVDAILANS